MDGEKLLVLRGNTIMETQYYAQFQNTDTSITSDELLVEENYIGLYK